jgi:hypothetical protein
LFVYPQNHSRNYDTEKLKLVKFIQTFSPFIYGYRFSIAV